MISVALALYIHTQCVKYEVPYEIVMAILRVENPTYDASAIHYNKNNTRDLGLFQINDKYLDSFVIAYWDSTSFDVFNPYDNARLAIAHLAWLYRYTKDWWLTTIAYNAGLTAVLENRIRDIHYKYKDMVFLVYMEDKYGSTVKRSYN